ncbi:MAG: hypothetical protein COV37_16440 [Bdellovibrio sp. CG11_big_fil_rev_8_21_14_0_20_39_38]|nr:MAG: hypothetical protein COV37_16440 [Bdellovibrio sp. CG11_big_fil_rev_8_21_14_0_20_39_38]
MRIKLALNAQQSLFSLARQLLGILDESRAIECDLPLSTSIRDGGHFLRALNSFKIQAGKLIERRQR